jgi:hypothetical protein
MTLEWVVVGGVSLVGVAMGFLGPGSGECVSRRVILILVILPDGIRFDCRCGGGCGPIRLWVRILPEFMCLKSTIVVAA